jgi:hypothetical protein
MPWCVVVPSSPTPAVSFYAVSFPDYVSFMSELCALQNWYQNLASKTTNI